MTTLPPLPIPSLLAPAAPNFPLYDMLVRRPSGLTELTGKGKRAPKGPTKQALQTLVKRVARMTDQEHEYLYSLIHYHALKTGVLPAPPSEIDPSEGLPPSPALPFSGRQIGRDVEFDLTLLPPDLKTLLFRFVDLHEKSQAERLV